MPIGRSKKKKLAPKRNSGALGIAEEAVKKFEKERDLLLSMQAEFGEKFPDASAFLNDIGRQEDLVQDSINETIPLIREVRQDVGEFKCLLKRSKPRYDDKEFMTLVAEIDNGGDILLELIADGHIKKVALDPSVATYFARHPVEAEHFQSAWRDAKDLTPAVTPPKL